MRTFLITVIALFFGFNAIADTGLDFPGNEATTKTIRFRFVNPHLNGLPIWGVGGSGLTYIWKAYPRPQGTAINGGYFTTFFWGNDGDFSWDYGTPNSFYGAHPYPKDNTYTTNTTTWWEIACDRGADILGTQVVYNLWYTQVLRVWADGSGKHHQFYYDWPDKTKVITHTASTSYGEINPPLPALTFGDAPWNPSREIYSGILRGFQIYAAKLSDTDVSSELVSPLSTAAGANSIWYLNLNPTPTNIADQSGRGNDPSWVGDARPSLYSTQSAASSVTQSTSSSVSGIIYLLLLK